MAGGGPITDTRIRCSRSETLDQGRQGLWRFSRAKNDKLYEGRDLDVTTDFRDVFAEAAQKHMGTKTWPRSFRTTRRRRRSFADFLARSLLLTVYPRLCGCSIGRSPVQQRISISHLQETWKAGVFP